MILLTILILALTGFCITSAINLYHDMRDNTIPKYADNIWNLSMIIIVMVSLIYFLFYV